MTNDKWWWHDDDNDDNDDNNDVNEKDNGNGDDHDNGFNIYICICIHAYVEYKQDVSQLIIWPASPPSLTLVVGTLDIVLRTTWKWSI